MAATIATEEKLKIPVLDAGYTHAKGGNIGKIFNNPEILRHLILYLSRPSFCIALLF
ncbi:hypothetical protein QUB70_04295 [Microcoleus sp. A003_D6]|uniref:hypothetical protein n=1 Tax=Microcoleus sp. A003_D6 TaxID=3055266 RepID=UPI002FD15119